MTSEIQYLKEIADALRKMGGSAGVSQLKSLGKITISGGTDASKLGSILADALVGLVIEEQSGGVRIEVEKSLIAMLKDALSRELRGAMFTTVTEDGVQVEKSLFAMMAEHISAI